MSTTTNTYKTVHWKNVPINAIVLGMEQYGDCKEDGTFHNLYFRKSEKEGCFLALVEFGEPIYYKPDNLIEWDILKNDESEDNIYGQVIILKENANLEDDIENWDNLINGYWIFLQEQEEKCEELINLLHCHKGTDLLDKLLVVAISYGEKLKESCEIGPKLIVVE